MKDSFLSEPARSLPVVGAWDVIVVGGGIAGIAAALAAARSGVSVLLTERFCALGGLATIGNVTIYLPLCDGCGRQVLSGITEELLRLSVHDLKKERPEALFKDIPEAWRDPASTPEARAARRFETGFNPDAVILSYEKLLRDAGVQILYDTRFCATARADGAVSHLIFENKSGRFAAACKTVIDASGDADVCFQAGEQTESLDTNVVSGWYYTLTDGGDLRMHCLSSTFSPDATREGADPPFFRGDDGWQVTEQMLAARDQLRAHLEKLRTENPEQDIQPFHITTFPCFRMTRRLLGACSITEADNHRWFDDAVCLANDWRRAGPVWSVPYRALLGVENNNLLLRRHGRSRRRGGRHGGARRRSPGGARPACDCRRTPQPRQSAQPRTLHRDPGTGQTGIGSRSTVTPEPTRDSEPTRNPGKNGTTEKRDYVTSPPPPPCAPSRC